MGNRQWNNPTQKKTESIFKLLKESAGDTNSLFRRGIGYAFDDPSFLGYIDKENNSLNISKNEEAFLEGVGNTKDSVVMTSHDKFFYVGETATAYRFRTEANESFVILKNSPVISDIIEVKMAVGDIHKDLITGKDVGGQDLPGDDLLGTHGDPKIDPGDGTLGKNALEKDAAKASGKAGEYGDDPIGGKKQGGEDLPGDELVGNHGDPKVSVGKLGKDPIFSTKETMDMEKEKDDEDAKKDDKEEEDKKKREKDKDDKDAEEDDKEEEKKGMKESKEEDEVEEDDKKEEEKKKKEKDKDDEDAKKDDKKEFDKKDREKNKDDKDAKKDDKEEEKKGMKESKNKDEDEDPENDKKDKKAGKDDDEKEAETEDEEVDEAASAFLQKLGSAVLRGLIKEMSESGSYKKFQNEDFIVEVAKRVSRIERTNGAQGLPKTMESTLVYPTTEGSLKFTDLAIFETVEGNFLVDQYNKNTVYKISNKDSISMLVKEGVTPNTEGLIKVENKVTFKVNGNSYSFN